jgi:hypothetical protein
MEKVMNAPLKSILVAAVATLPGIAFAQMSDAKYCSALVNKYESFLDQSQKKGEQPQNLAVKAAVEKCKAGDTSGIATIETALRDAKIDLPAR